MEYKKGDKVWYDGQVGEVDPGEIEVLVDSNRIEVVTLPKAVGGQVIRIKNTNGRPLIIRPAPGDAFATEEYVVELRAWQIARGKTVWEFE